jgi:pimeloyl-ACP methyl ester carboxylesterase
MPKATVDGISLFYQETGLGSAEPLVLIMGWGGDHTVWALQAHAFAAEHRVISFDNRGAGQSDAPDVPYTITGMARDTLALLDQLGIQRAHICGASMGGMIAQEIALMAPERVLTLQLHCSLARIDAYGRFLTEVFLKVKGRGDVEEFARFSLPWLLSRKTMAENPEFVRLWIERAIGNPYPTSLVGLTRQAQAVAGHDTLDRLGGIHLPTLITTGADDILVPPACSQELHARIPSSELVVISDAGHVHFIERFEKFNETCLDFLRKHRGG